MMKLDSIAAFSKCHRFAIIVFSNIVLCTVFFIKITTLTHRVEEVQHIRLSLPESFQTKVTDLAEKKTTELIATSLNDTQQRLEVLVDHLSEVAEKQFQQEANNRKALFQEILEAFQNKSETTLTNVDIAVEGMQKNAHVRDSVFKMEIKEFSENSFQALNTFRDKSEATLQQITRMMEQQMAHYLEKRQQEQREAAMKAFELYTTNPTNETALICLETAIRKDPSNLKYIRALRETTFKPEHLQTLVQEYQTMLAHSLNTANANAIPELINMVHELDEKVQSHNNQVEQDEKQASQERTQKLRELFVSLPEPNWTFDLEDQKNLQRRLDILQSLIAEGLDNVQEEEALQAEAEQMLQATSAALAISEHLAQVNQARSNISTGDIKNEEQLEESLEALTNSSIIEPLLLAQQELEKFHQIETSLLSEASRNAYLKKREKVVQEIQAYIQAIDDDRYNILNLYIAGIVTSFQSYPYVQYGAETEKIKTSEMRLNVLAKYTQMITTSINKKKMATLQENCISSLKTANNNRMAKYQVFANEKLLNIVKRIIDDEKNTPWEMFRKREYKKQQAESELRRDLAIINRGFLEPELNELYREVYDLLMKDYMEWVNEKVERSQEKAKLLYDMATTEKRSLEKF